MTRRFLMMAAAASLALPAASRAQDILKPAPVAVNLPWKINCRDLSNVPMTVDSLQAIPMKLVAKLNCGEGVAVLSDMEAYTVNVRTADGRTGYVMSLYLMKAPPPKVAPHVAPASASTNNGVARWRSGAKGCDQFTKDGAVVESLTANDVTVQVSLQDTGAKLRATVAIGNFGDQHVYVNPVGITLESTGGHGKSLAYRDPAQLAKEAQQGASGNGAVKADYQVSDFSPVFASVYTVQRQPVQDLTRPQAKPTMTNVTDAFSAGALKKGSLGPDGKAWGSVWFERDANPSQYVMRVPIDNQIFEFPLTLNQ